ncbi:hypothetical protein [Clostridium sp.]|uniref:hypothetical protein n=1 Tax=Clostridium sp. TaxID=1506 RepID=UPI0029026DB6|nr:hypothetical protein [Clostridium sp.]MDU2156357.1 hypothetical protein [Clostridium sp.]
MKQTITMYCIFDKTREKYKIYNPYYDVWHEPFWLDTYVESSSLMKSDLEALNILKKLYKDKSTNYKKKIENKEIVIKKVILQVMRNIEEYETYEITEQTQ